MDYVKIAATVTKLINANGRDITISKIDKATQDPNKPWKQSTTPPALLGSLATRGVFVPPSGTGFGMSFVPAELLARCDEVLLVGPAVEDMDTYNLILDNGLRYSIEWVYKLKPNFNVLLYAFGTKR